MKKRATFCRFFARSVLFFIKLFYLCTDFPCQPICGAVATKFWRPESQAFFEQ